MEKRHEEEMERMHKVLLQYRLAEQKQVSERAGGSTLMQRVVSALVAFCLQSSK